MSKIYLIDGTALIYRAYFAFISNPLRNSRGENTSAIFGVANSFLKLFNDLKAERMIISFDLKEPTFRHEISEDYKANRPPAPDELISQIEPVKEFFKLLGIPEISIPGYEADDVLATLTQQLKKNYDIVLITSDKDFIQLLNDNVSIFDPFSEKNIDSETVKEKYGVLTSQFVDYLAIVGDSSDNIPGIKGIGAKGAAGLLNQFRDLDEIYNNLDQIRSESVRKKVAEGKETAYLSRMLAKIETEVPVVEKTGIVIEELAKKAELEEANFQQLIPFLQKYELNSFQGKLLRMGIIKEPSSNKNEEADKAEMSAMNVDNRSLSEQKAKDTNNCQDQDEEVIQLSFDFYQSAKSSSVSCKIISSESEFASFMEQVSKKQEVALNVVSNPYSDKFPADIWGISMSVDTNEAVYLSLMTKDKAAVQIKRINEGFDRLSDGTIIIGHNLKHHLRLLEKSGIKLEKPFFDTMVASYLLDPSTSRHSLKDSAQRELQYQFESRNDLSGNKDGISPDQEAQTKDIAPYAAEETTIVLKLYERYKSLMQSNNLIDLFRKIEMPLLPVLFKMEKEGVYIDCEILKEINKELSEEIDRLTKQIYSLSGKEFNINSTQQLSKILFEEMNIPPVKKTKTGYSTDNSVLEVLADDYEVAGILIDYRQFTKLRSTYVESLPQLINKETGRIHSSFNQTVTSTGRLSSSQPNLQNIPIRSKVGKQIRKAFKAGSEDYCILAADYSQIELRILGILSKDRNLITAFNNNQDIHAQTAGLILNKPITLITQDERRMAKAINFGIVYGMGANKLARETNISHREAREFIEVYFTKFARVKEYIEQQKEKAKRYGYAETIMGRRLIIPNIHSSNQRLRSEAERIAVNMPIQGSAADIMKMAMIRLDRKLEEINNLPNENAESNRTGETRFSPDKENPPLVKMIIQVHDELVFEVNRRVLEKVSDIVVTEMKNALPEKYRIIIPLIVDIGFGNNWFEAHA